MQVMSSGQVESISKLPRIELNKQDTDTTHTDEALKVLAKYNNGPGPVRRKDVLREFDRRLLSLLICTYALQYCDRAMLPQVVIQGGQLVPLINHRLPHPPTQVGGNASMAQSIQNPQAHIQRGNSNVYTGAVGCYLYYTRVEKPASIPDAGFWPLCYIRVLSAFPCFFPFPGFSTPSLKMSGLLVFLCRLISALYINNDSVPVAQL